MHCSRVALPGTDSRFHLPAAAITTASAKRVSFTTRRSSLGSIGAKAAVSDGFSSEAAQLSFYDLLGFPESGSLPEIKQAYKQLARKYHPDVSPPDRVQEYTETFIRVQEAYETLSDPSRRAMYDSDMARGLHLAFSARRWHQTDEEVQRGEWKNQWQSQLSELKRRSMGRDVGSWAARMRAKGKKPSTES